eukprot:TRINITY_DN19158_c0_g1_i1.p1 TRINITY_DN19158_c0_g1~~TRINITY_DN19158_c0_g1_i1.p1  ORF type:complete len:691 (-),score=107.86 TRINITY_DN19158_c0_g1_i1:363-2435(-)
MPKLNINRLSSSESSLDETSTPPLSPVHRSPSGSNAEGESEATKPKMRHSTLMQDVRNSTRMSTSHKTSTLKMRGCTNTALLLGAEQDLLLKVDEKLNAFNSKDAESKELEDEWSFNAARRLALSLVRSHGYQTVMATMTVVSVVLLVRETDQMARSTGASMEETGMNLALLGIYIVDIVIRLYALERVFFNSWVSILEMVLVISDLVLELWTGLPGILKACKVVRFLRLGRVIRGSNKFRELYLMCLGILTSIRAVLFGTALVGCALLLFAILAVFFVRPVVHQIDDRGGFQDCEYCGRAFDTVLGSCMTFMSTVIAGDSWGVIARPLVEDTPSVAILIFLPFFVIQLGLLNTIAAVIVDRQVQARADDEEYMLMIQAEELVASLEKMCEIFEALDTDGTRHITLPTMSEYYDEYPDFRALLNRIDIHRDQLNTVFEILDKDNNGQIDFGEFVSGLHNLRSEDLRTICMLARHFSQSTWTAVAAIHESVQSQAASISQLEAGFRNLLIHEWKAEKAQSVSPAGREDTKPSGIGFSSTPEGAHLHGYLDDKSQANGIIAESEATEVPPPRCKAAATTQPLEDLVRSMEALSEQATDEFDGAAVRATCPSEKLVLWPAQERIRAEDGVQEERRHLLRLASAAGAGPRPPGAEVEPRDEPLPMAQPATSPELPMVENHGQPHHALTCEPVHA